MPGNTIGINNAIEYYVGDSKMDELMEWLNKNGLVMGHGYSKLMLEVEEEGDGYSR